MESLNVRHDELHLKYDNGKPLLSITSYSLTNEGRKRLCEWVVNVQVSDGYSTNLSRCVNVLKHKILCMKTHDCHVFLERLLPLIVREVLSKQVCDALIEVNTFFHRIMC